MRLGRAIVAGLVGTVVMTMLMLVGPVMGMPKMLIGEMLGSFMGIGTALGWVMHVVIGEGLLTLPAADLAKLIAPGRAVIAV